MGFRAVREQARRYIPPELLPGAQANGGRRKAGSRVGKGLAVNTGAREYQAPGRLGLETRFFCRSCAQSLFYGTEALGLHTKGSWQRLNKHIARGAAVALDLHTSVTPEIAANDLQWRNAEFRVQLAQMRLLWDLQHSAPRKARRIYRAAVSSTEPLRTSKAACAPWHLAAHELQRQIEESHPVSISTSTKKQWLSGATAFLSTKYSSFWHDLLEARTTPPAPPAAPSRTGLRPRPNAPAPPPARVLAPEDFVREVVSMPVGDTLHFGQVSSYSDTMPASGNGTSNSLLGRQPRPLSVPTIWRGMGRPIPPAPPRQAPASILSLRTSTAAHQALHGSPLRRGSRPTGASSGPSFPPIATSPPVAASAAAHLTSSARARWAHKHTHSKMQRTCASSASTTQPSAARFRRQLLPGATKQGGTSPSK
jgi:hypothetical protein